MVDRERPTIPCPADARREFLVTSYMLGAPLGTNLGAPGYSHEFVARLFSPLLERWGQVRMVKGGTEELQAAAAACRRRGATPVHFSVLPFQDTHILADAVNVVVPAWEFPDVPDHAFARNPRNNWPMVANQADLVIVSGPFTRDALRRAGTTTPIEIVPVPTDDAYFAIPPWNPEEVTRVASWAYAFDAKDRAPRHPACEEGPRARPKQNFRASKVLEGGLKYACSRVIGRRRRERLSEMIKDWRHKQRTKSGRPSMRGLPFPEVDVVELSGVVYTSIFAPDDGRKNWTDMLNAFLYTLGHRDDVTLVFKLISKSRKSVGRVMNYYLDRDIKHRCRVVFLCDFLPDEQMVQLCKATTYYLQATKAEGNCLPLMNHLGAGRPGISPRHSSMTDYFDTHSGFVVDSHPEPCAWPHDPQWRLRSTWGRIVWPSLCEQIEQSFELATRRSQAYAQLAANARGRMQSWAGRHAVQARLDAALTNLFATRSVRSAQAGRSAA